MLALAMDLVVLISRSTPTFTNIAETINGIYDAL